MNVFRMKRSCLIFAPVCCLALLQIILIILWRSISDDRMDREMDANPRMIFEMDQSFEVLWTYIRNHHIYPPSELEYNFSNRTVLKLDSKVDDIAFSYFKNEENGFFVEVGAYDGFATHSLYLERFHGWTGLLIECNPMVIPLLKAVHRKAYVSNLCLSTGRTPAMARMKAPLDNSLPVGSLYTGSSLKLPLDKHHTFTTFNVLTIPLTAIIASLDVFVVDLLILGVEGLEWKVVRHFPFDLIQVKVWIIQFNMIRRNDKHLLENFMVNHSYAKSMESATHFVFAHSSVL